MGEATAHTHWCVCPQRTLLARGSRPRVGPLSHLRPVPAGLWLPVKRICYVTTFLAGGGRLQGRPPPGPHSPCQTGFRDVPITNPSPTLGSNTRRFSSSGASPPPRPGEASPLRFLLASSGTGSGHPDSHPPPGPPWGRGCRGRQVRGRPGPGVSGPVSEAVRPFGPGPCCAPPGWCGSTGTHPPRGRETASRLQFNNKQFGLYFCGSSLIFPQ